MKLISKKLKFVLLTLPIALVLGCNSKSAPSEIVCGGPMNFVCPADMYCNSKENCGGIDGNGVCTIRPTQCRPDNQPVCGCDGQTYSSPCLAAAKGVSQKEVGECKSPIEIDNSEEPSEEPSGEEGLDDGMSGE